MTFGLMGRSPIRFKYTEDALEASWTFSPDDEDLPAKLQAMLNFLVNRGAGTPAVPPADAETWPVRAPMEPPAVPNGWELLSKEESDNA